MSSNPGRYWATFLKVPSKSVLNIHNDFGNESDDMAYQSINLAEKYLHFASQTVLMHVDTIVSQSRLLSNQTDPYYIASYIQNRQYYHAGLYDFILIDRGFLFSSKKNKYTKKIFNVFVLIRF